MTKLLKVGVLSALFFCGFKQDADACEFCSSRKFYSLSELRDEEDITVLVSVDSIKEPSNESDHGAGEFTITKVQHTTTKSSLKVGDRIQLNYFAKEAKVGDQVLMMGTCAHNQLEMEFVCGPMVRVRDRIETSQFAASDFQWGSLQTFTKELMAYLDNIPPKSQREERIKYFLSNLDASDEAIAEDAFYQVSNLSYQEMIAIAPHMNSEKIRGLLFNKSTPFDRLAHYGLMLGLCGNQDDARAMEEKILEKHSFGLSGVEGIVAGYLLLTKDDGIKFLVENRIQPFVDPNKKLACYEGFAPILTLRFVCDEVDTGQLNHDSVKSAMRLYLTRPDISDLAIRDLARWNDWSIADKLLEMFHDQRFDQPENRKEIVIYFLRLLDADLSNPSSPDDATIEKAKSFIKDLETNNPMLLKHARNIYR